MNTDQARIYFGEWQTVRLVVLRNRVRDQGGAIGYESLDAHKRGHDAEVVEVAEYNERWDTLRLSCGHELTYAHDDENGSLPSAITTCPHLG